MLWIQRIRSLPSLCVMPTSSSYPFPSELQNSWHESFLSHRRKVIDVWLARPAGQFAAIPVGIVPEGIVSSPESISTSDARAIIRIIEASSIIPEQAAPKSSTHGSTDQRRIQDMHDAVAIDIRFDGCCASGGKHLNLVR